MEERQKMDQAIEAWRQLALTACVEWLVAEKAAIQEPNEAKSQALSKKKAGEAWARVMHIYHGEGLEVPEGYRVIDPW